MYILVPSGGGEARRRKTVRELELSVRGGRRTFWMNSRVVSFGSLCFVLVSEVVSSEHLHTAVAVDSRCCVHAHTYYMLILKL